MILTAKDVSLLEFVYHAVFLEESIQEGLEDLLSRAHPMGHKRMWGGGRVLPNDFLVIEEVLQAPGTPASLQGPLEEIRGRLRGTARPADWSGRKVRHEADPLPTRRPQHNP